VKIKTKPLGEVEIKEEAIIHIERGIIGFEGITRYVILDTEKDSPFKWLQAVDKPSLAFIVIPPVCFRPDYKLEVSEEDLASIGIEDPSTAVVLAIVVVPRDDPSRMTANLQGPVVINPKTRKGKQMISTNPQYSVRHYILDELKAYAEREARLKNTKGGG
jgi:flagellar assembly factor FliW